MKPVLLQGPATLQIFMQRERFRFEPGEEHRHHCPVCYKDAPCSMECDFEYDQSDFDGDRLVVARGVITACDECRKEES